MISAVAWTRVKFEDVPIDGALPDFVIKAIAAILACGFWHVRDGSAWIQDVRTGKKHIQDFRHAKRATLSREVEARFEANVLVIEGRPMTAPDVAEQYAQDPAFRRRCEALPKFAGLCRRLSFELAKPGPCFAAREGNRQLILPAHGAMDVKLDLATDYEN